MFCVKCGRHATVDNFCDDCFLEKNELFRIKDFVINYCRGCSKFFDAGKDIVLEDGIAKRLKSDNNLKDLRIETKFVGNKIHVTVTCSGIIEPCKKLKTERKNILVIMKKMMCEDCKRLSGNYYEAVIQIRGDSENILKRVERLSRGMLVSGINNVSNGYDVRFVNKKDAGVVVNVLRSKYNVRYSFKLVGEKKGKKLYRNFYAVR